MVTSGSINDFGEEGQQLIGGPWPPKYGGRGPPYNYFQSKIKSFLYHQLSHDLLADATAQGDAAAVDPHDDLPPVVLDNLHFPS